MTKAKILPPAEALNSVLRYEPETGKLFWRLTGCLRCDNKFGEREAFTCTTNQGYKIGGVLGLTYTQAHRVIWKMMTGEDPDVVDHINGKRADNKWSNLRSVCVQDNARNKGLAKDNTTGRTGVYRNRSRRNPWRATIMIRGQSTDLGQFRTFELACAARKAAELAAGLDDNYGKAR